MRLYEITESYQRALSELFDPETGEVNETSLAILEQQHENFQQKGISLVHHIKNVEANIGSIDQEIARLNKLRKTIEAQSDWLRNYLLSNMTANGITEISCPYLTIKTRQCAESLDVPNEDVIPQSYFNEKTTYTLDKIRLKKDLQAGLQVFGASLKRNVSLKIS